MTCAHLCRHPQYSKKWDWYFANKIGRLCLAVGRNEYSQHCIKGTKIFFVIHFQDIPKTRINELCYTSVLCQERPGKIDPNRTRIIICGTNVHYPGNVRTKIASLEILKIIIKSVVSRAAETFVAFEISNFDLDTSV